MLVNTHMMRVSLFIFTSHSLPSHRLPHPHAFLFSSSARPFLTPSPNSPSSPIHFTLPLVCRKGNNTITSKHPLSALCGQTDTDRPMLNAPRLLQSPVHLLCSFSHPHLITTNYMQFNYYGAGALLFIS